MCIMREVSLRLDRQEAAALVDALSLAEAVTGRTVLEERALRKLRAALKQYRGKRGRAKRSSEKR